MDSSHAENIAKRRNVKHKLKEVTDKSPATRVYQTRSHVCKPGAVTKNVLLACDQTLRRLRTQVSMQSATV